MAELANMQALTLGDFRLRSKQYLENCSLNNKPDTVEAKKDAYEKFLAYLHRSHRRRDNNRQGNHLLEHRDIERLTGDDALETVILLFGSA